MIDFESIFSNYTSDISDNQKRIKLSSAIGIYYGLSKEGNLRISFLTSNTAPKFESTRLLKVTQGFESESVYWICFDLTQVCAKQVFFTFCSDLVGTIDNIHDEASALSCLKNRYHIWRSLFKKDISSVTSEMIQGLYGELYFLKNYMIPQFGVNSAISAWSGPEQMSKDFSLGNNWYEIKTIASNSPIVKISSAAQLSSQNDGHLVIIKVETMSAEFDKEMSSVGGLFKLILEDITDEDTKESFLNKLSIVGFDSSDEFFSKKFDVKTLASYIVNSEFPRISENDIKHPEICNVNYSLFINTLSKFKED